MALRALARATLSSPRCGMASGARPTSRVSLLPPPARGFLHLANRHRPQLLQQQSDHTSPSALALQQSGRSHRRHIITNPGPFNPKHPFTEALDIPKGYAEWQIELKEGLSLDTYEEIAGLVEERLNNPDGVSRSLTSEASLNEPPEPDSTVVVIYLRPTEEEGSVCHLAFKYPENADPHDALATLRVGSEINWIRMSGRSVFASLEG